MSNQILGMSEGTFWVVVFAEAFFMAIICALIANSKNRSSLGYFICGFFFGLIALIIVAVVPRVDEAFSQEQRKCPYCLGNVPVRATKCKHCGSSLVAKGVPDIAEGDLIEISREIKVNEQVAFKKGEKARVEFIDPDPERPENKYIVLSIDLNKRFRLSKWDMSFIDNVDFRTFLTRST